jgi:hypothetical protein
MLDNCLHNLCLRHAPYPYARTPMEMTSAAMYTLQLYTSGGVGLSSGARAKPPMLTNELNRFKKVEKAGIAIDAQC